MGERVPQVRIGGRGGASGLQQARVLADGLGTKARFQSLTAIQADTWSRFCRIGTVSDFRAHTRYRTGSIGDLDSLTEGGEFLNKTIPDGEKASITASTKGNLINLTRQAIINDDLGAFVGLAADFGRAAKRTIENAVQLWQTDHSGCPTMAQLKSDGKINRNARDRDSHHAQRSPHAPRDPPSRAAAPRPHRRRPRASPHNHRPGRLHKQRRTGIDRGQDLARPAALHRHRH